MNNIYQTEFKAWSCDFILEIIEPTRDTDSILAEIKSTLLVYENSFSRFLGNSDLHRLNAGQSIEKTPLWETVLAQAVSLTETIGDRYFNPHVDLAGHGYASSIETLKSKSLLTVEEKTIPVFPKGIIEDDKRIILESRVSLDFGSFLKGYVSAEIADRYAPFGKGIVVNFGGDITVRGKDEGHDFFSIGIYNPMTKHDHWIDLKNQSLCTSGTYKRMWQNSDGMAHHILDPQRHASSDSEFVSISFWGPDAVLCDAMATAAFNAPPSQWEIWKKRNPQINYLAIKKNGKTVTSTK